jgi:ADP-heptose:LPS heptosyltransferase
MGLESEPVFPTLVLSPEEIEEGRKRIQALIHRDEAPIVGVFVGGRKSRGKRWARENFLKLVAQLRAEDTRPIVFVGPEEKGGLPYFQKALQYCAPVIFEPDARSFAALLAHCHLFVACDSGPVHLACALRVRTIAIFLKNDFDRWGPPAALGRIVHHEDALTVNAVLDACRCELLKSTPADGDIAKLDSSACRSMVSPMLQDCDCQPVK